jgi:pimeloyl-ACP methyl ester carboxylesterase
MRLMTIALAAFALSGCTTLTIEERNFLRPDKAGVPAAPRSDLQAAVPGLRLSEMTIPTVDGATLRGVIARQPAATATVLYFGGNAFHLDPDGAQLLPLIAACGVNVAVFDYRGYGRSSGVPTVANMADDAVLAFDQVSAQLPGRVIVHGMSLGSFMAAHVAAQRPQTAGLVLEATATNAADWADANVPWYARAFMRLEVAESLRGVDNVAAAAAYRGDALVLAGSRDRVTPPALGQRVYAAMAPQRRRWILLDGVGHSTMFNRAEVRPAYCAFVSKGIM